MADTYNVNVTLDDFNSFITSEKVVNENNQELNDYVCNVTYTNLQDGQIAAIGQEFANRLSDTDENGNSKTGLHKLALSGNYNDLENKPSASNLQGFHKAAFSGNTSDLNNDEGFLTEETEPIFIASAANSIQYSDIANWNNILNEIRGTNDLNALQTKDIYDNIIHSYINLQSIKNEIEKKFIIFDLATDYNYTTFGDNNFFTRYENENKHLIEDVFNIYNGEQQILFKVKDSNYWVVNNLITSEQYKAVILNNLTSNYNSIEHNDTQEVLENLEVLENNCLIYYDLTSQITYFKFISNINYVPQQLFKFLFDYARDLNASGGGYYPLAPNKEDYDEDGYLTYSQVVTMDYLHKILSQYQLKEDP